MKEEQRHGIQGQIIYHGQVLFLLWTIANNVKYFVPITRQQRVVMKDTFKHRPNEDMPMEEWNSLLETLLKANVFATPLIFASVNIIDPDEQWIISVLEDNEDMTSCDHVIESVTDCVSKITLPSNVMNYEISHGMVDSRMYYWPFENSISGNWLDVVETNTS